jgi:predicted nucleic acid-binding Zn ribbon protein
MSAKLLKKCPECKKMKLIRLIGAGSAVIFKGNGFYETDYNRSKDYKKKAKAEKTPKKAKEKKQH